MSAYRDDPDALIKALTREVDTVVQRWVRREDPAERYLTWQLAILIAGALLALAIAVGGGLAWSHLDPDTMVERCQHACEASADRHVERITETECVCGGSE